MSHTPTPWAAECVGSGGDYDNPVDVYEITAGNGRRLVAEHVGKEDAVFIVRAVNSHAELLAALEALLKVCDEELDPKRTPEMRDARIAIAKARGQ